MKNATLIKFCEALDAKIIGLRKEMSEPVRVYRITAPVAKKDIEVVLQRAPNLPPDRVLTLFRPSWEWSPVTYWCEDQI